MSPLTHTLGYPRIGDQRQHKRALEAYWGGRIGRNELEARMTQIRQKNWREQQAAGIDLVASNDFSLYDHVLDTSRLVGAVPHRFGHTEGEVDLDTYFAMARGGEPPAIQEGTSSAVSQVVALGLRKFLNTNYHYLVPEFRPDQRFRLSSTKPFDEFSEALALGVKTKPVLLGPVSYLQLGVSEEESFDHLSLLQSLLPVYEEVLRRLQALGAEWVQFDEPILVRNLTGRERQAFPEAYASLRAAAKRAKLILGTYFGDLRDNLDTTLALPVDAVHLDATAGTGDVERAVPRMRSDQSLSVGIVNGRNVWINDLSQSLDLLERLQSRLGSDRLLIAPSSSLQFVPLDVEKEKRIDAKIRSWLAFARQKLAEVVTLRDALMGSLEARDRVQANAEILAAREQSPLRRNEAVQDQLRELRATGVPRRISEDVRQRLQAQALQLPILPTTTIGSFPQTAEIRAIRARYERGEISEAEYESFLQETIAETIALQERIGLDVLVDGESPRPDMVQYFAEQLDGLACTDHGWVQSYGSRCVKPPIIYGDVSRSRPMTVKWSQYAQSRTQKPVKGMLTGPTTMLQWSYVRDDVPRKEVCDQIALAVRAEVLDLERAGIRIIQVDEPAFREGLPLRTEDRSEYLRWASEAFRLTVSGVRPETQVHTHMCYAQFQDILSALKDLDIDVISFEAARSRMALLQALDASNQPFAVGPGVWDVHSPRVPSVDEFVSLLRQAAKFVPPWRIWGNPDCGFKTRENGEVIPGLRNLVQAADIVRASLT